MNKIIEKIKKDNKLLVLILLALVLIAAGILLVVTNNDSSNNGTNEINGIKEEEVISKEEALNIIKPLFNGDNYEFSVEQIIGESYKVTVTNNLTGNIYYYFVDAKTKSYYLKTE